MTDTLLQAYLPLFFWIGVGLLSLKMFPEAFPRLLGRSLYWVGVPLQIFTLARQMDLTAAASAAPVITGIALLGGGGLAWLVIQGLLKSRATLSPLTADRQGSFIIAAILGNTGFVGLAVAPSFVPEPYQSWLVLYSVTQNVVGTYGLGVFLASYYGRSGESRPWWVPLRDVLTVPSLWAFCLGWLSHSTPLPQKLEGGLHAVLWLVIACALVLMGMRLRQIQGWNSLRLAVLPALIKTLLMPLGVALLTLVWGLPPAASLALVLMAGMPSAFAGLILAEEYELDRDLIASSIVVTTGLLFVTIPLWLLLTTHL